jgi:hypothetical protein
MWALSSTGKIDTCKNSQNKRDHSKGNGCDYISEVMEKENHFKWVSINFLGKGDLSWTLKEE